MVGRFGADVHVRGRGGASRASVRCAGIDIGSIAPTAAPEPASRPSRLAAAALGLYESAQAACRPTSPDRADYLALKARGLAHPARR